MKTYDERTQSIASKVKKKKTQRKIIATAITGCCCIALSLVLFLPNDHQPNDISQHQEDPYYPLIQTLQKLTYQAPGHTNNLDLWFGSAVDSDMTYDAPTEDAVPDAAVNGSVSDTGTGSSYQETTDLQVQGVGEADLIKRTDKHIFYLNNETLKVYSIQGEASSLVGSYDIEIPNRKIGYGLQMYLSQDCSTVTILTECYDTEKCVYAISLDVTDPENICKNSELALAGDYHSSRLIDGKLYLISRYYVASTPDFEDKSTYLPSYEIDGERHYLSMDCIVVPEDATSAMYTVVSKIDSKTLQMEDAEALLSYAGSEYVSQENIFLTRSYTKETEQNEETLRKTMTEISQLRYGEDGLEYVAGIHVEGSVNNQYNLDEKDGILRVVTTTNSYRMIERTNGEYAYVTQTDSSTNASLYCIDLSDHSIRASVENFAPEGESVRSVRFDGDTAYVCTSIVVQDPVFFFDLSDLDNITCKDTGTIPGYSMSLVNFGDGFLMGIGYNSSFDLKIEIYREAQASVESYCSYENPCGFSTDYKSYYIDRENHLIGLGIRSYGSDSPEYVLLCFDGYELVELLRVPLSGSLYDMRAVYIDGYLYMLADEFRVEKIA